MTEHPDRRPLVSIIVPSFNQGRYIRETIESCLNQRYRPLEVLVFDGGSTDETVAVLESLVAPELRWWSARDKGVVDAVNKGLRLARGEILSIQSSDDLFVAGAIEAATTAISAEPGLGLVFGDVEHIDENSHITGRDVQGAFDLAAYLGRLSYVPQPGTFFTRRALLDVGEWSDKCSYAADAHFWMRIATRFPVRKLDQVVARYRYHADQRDTQTARIARDWQIAVLDIVARGDLTNRQRRHAMMGINLAQYRYAPEADWLSRTLSLYAAVLKNPTALLDPRFPKRELFPGRTPIWSFLSSCKRRIGLAQRGH